MGLNLYQGDIKGYNPRVSTKQRWIRTHMLLEKNNDFKVFWCYKYSLLKQMLRVDVLYC